MRTHIRHSTRGALAAALLATGIAGAPSVSASMAAPEIVFVRTNAGQAGGVIYRMPAGGGTPTPFLVRHKCPPCHNEYDPVTNSGNDPLVGAANPSLAPDGSQLRYESVHPQGMLEFQMMTTAVLDSVQFRYSYPAGIFGLGWSPDSTTVAFSKLRAQGTAIDIWTVNKATTVAGTAETLVATDAMQPTYSPSGEHIAFIRNVDGMTGGLWIMNADGTAAEQVPGPIDPVDPQWSPDGSKIAYVEQALASPAVSFVRPQGGSVTTVGIGADPSWTADSKTLLYSDGPAPSDGTLTGASIYSIAVDGGSPVQLTTPVGATYADSAPIYFGPQQAKDVTRPGVVRDLTAVAARNAITLQWSAADDDDWAGVEVRQLEGSTPPNAGQGSLVYRGYRRSVTLPAITGKNYSFAVFAYDASGNVSDQAATRTVRTVPRQR